MTDGTDTWGYHEIKLLRLLGSEDDIAGYPLSFKKFLKVVVW